MYKGRRISQHAEIIIVLALRITNTYFQSANEFFLEQIFSSIILISLYSVYLSSRLLADGVGQREVLTKWYHIKVKI